MVSYVFHQVGSYEFEFTKMGSEQMHNMGYKKLRDLIFEFDLMSKTNALLYVLGLFAQLLLNFLAQFFSRCVLLFGLSVVRFVRTPEVLERFVTIEREISQLENSIKSFKASNADGETQVNTKHSWKLPGLFAPAKA